jgi:signal transduction histidine kinase
MTPRRSGSGTLVGVIDALRARLAANPILVDAVIALGLTLASIVAIAGGAQDAGSREPLSVALLLLETIPLIARRRWPLGILIVTVVVTVLHASMAGPEGLNESLGAMVAVYTVAAETDRRTSLSATLATAAAFAVLIVTKGTFPANFQGLLQTLMIVGLFWAVGDWTRTRRLYAQADRDRIRLLEAEREERARRAVLEERERIARELHDVVTPHVSVIVIQAGAGLTALDRRPEAAREALHAIDRTARQALTDMRRMLGIMGEAAPEGDVARQPMPGLDRLGELVEQVRSAGLPVELAIAGERRRLDAGVELSAYRIVQEALTNALKHAAGARARVELAYGADALDIRVTDEGGRGRHDVAELGEGGRGLIGMRERVGVFGGAFEAGPTLTGFTVHASLPALPDGTLTP